MAQTEPFEIRVPQAVLDDLQLRLESTRWTPAERAGWAQGTNRKYLRELVAHWRSGYDWGAHERRLNTFGHYKADVAGARLHFIHERGRGPQPMPLLLLHGWPDSFYRYHKVIASLADPKRVGVHPDEAFDVVVPSLPGFGFTGIVEGDGRLPPMRQSAEWLWRLMTEVLGFGRFLVAGGDGGSVLAQLLAIHHPESVAGIHLTDLGWHATQRDPAPLTRPEKRYLAAMKKHFIADGAYAMVQTSQPHALAAGLNDSPTGLASWLVDRFHSWTDQGLGGEPGVTVDELLTNIMLYWSTQTIGASVHSYFSDARAPSLSVRDYVERPVALALFPKEPGGTPPRALAERTLNVVRWNEQPRGGHFAALEAPDLFAADLFAFGRELRTGKPSFVEETHHVAPGL